MTFSTMHSETLRYDEELRKTVSIKPNKNISEIVELLRIQSQFPESNLTKEFSHCVNINF